MRFVRVDAVIDDGWHQGYTLDVDAYLRVLPQIQADLPEGARRFALDEEHYNFFGPRCVKDLTVGHITLRDANDHLSAAISFAPNKFKHDAGLAIHYTDVTEFLIDVTSTARTENVWPETKRLGDLQLDEILPHDDGCSHEIQLTGGLIRIVCSDLIAEWSRTAKVIDSS